MGAVQRVTDSFYKAAASHLVLIRDAVQALKPLKRGITVLSLDESTHPPSCHSLLFCVNVSSLLRYSRSFSDKWLRLTVAVFLSAGRRSADRHQDEGSVACVAAAQPVSISLEGKTAMKVNS